jgi:hypothetical protein
VGTHQKFSSRDSLERSWFSTPNSKLVHVITGSGGTQPIQYRVTGKETLLLYRLAEIASSR